MPLPEHATRKELAMPPTGPVPRRMSHATPGARAENDVAMPPSTASEVAWLQNVAVVLRSLATLEIEARSCFPAGASSKMSMHKITKERVSLVRTVRCRMDALRTKYDGAKLPAPGVFHVDVLDARLDFDAAMESLAKESARLVTVFGSAWAKDLDNLCSAIEELCPRWSGHRDTILEKPEMLDALADNPSHTQCASLAGVLREQVRCVKTLHNDHKGIVVDAAIVRKATQTVDYAVETVTLSYVLHLMYRVWPPKITNVLGAQGCVRRSHRGQHWELVGGQLRLVFSQMSVRGCSGP